MEDVVKNASSAQEIFAYLSSHLGLIGAGTTGLIVLAVLVWWRWNDIKQRPGVAALTSPWNRPARFAMLSLFKTNPQVWKADDSGSNTFVMTPFELIGNPVFEFVLANDSDKPLLVRRVGVRLLSRKAEEGGMGGAAERVEIQAQLKVICPEEWRTRYGQFANEPTVWAEIDAPFQLEDRTAVFRGTLEVANLFDGESATTTEIRFVADTDHGITESPSYWLRQ